MTDTATAAPRLAIPSARGIDDALAAWRGIGKEQRVGALLLAFVAVAPRLYILFDRSIAEGHSLTAVWPAALQSMVVPLINAFSLLLAVVLADKAVDRGAPRFRAYATAVMGGILAGTVAGWLINTFVIGSLLAPSEAIAAKFRINPRAVFTVGISIWLEWMVLGALATFVYADRREVRRMAAALKAAQDSRLAQVRRQLESELLAMQARIEPQFLFDALGHIQQLYETNPADAERMLDGLIAFLRAAMPQMRDTTSTLEKEVALLFAYVAVQGIRFSSDVACTALLPDELRDVRMPPMIVIPLLEQAMSLQMLGAATGGAVRVEAAADGTYVRVKIQTSNCRLLSHPFVGEPAALGERLLALYQSDAKIVLSQTGAHAAEGTFMVPRELVPRSREAMPCTR